MYIYSNHLGNIAPSYIYKTHFAGMKPLQNSITSQLGAARWGPRATAASFKAGFAVVLVLLTRTRSLLTTAPSEEMLERHQGWDGRHQCLDIVEIDGCNFFSDAAGKCGGHVFVCGDALRLISEKEAWMPWVCLQVWPKGCSMCCDNIDKVCSSGRGRDISTKERCLAASLICMILQSLQQISRSR